MQTTHHMRNLETSWDKCPERFLRTGTLTFLHLCTLHYVHCMKPAYEHFLEIINNGKVLPKDRRWQD